jgi:hypothetical protein
MNGNPEVIRAGLSGLVMGSRLVFTNAAALGQFVPGAFYRGFLRGFLVPHSDDGSSEK